MTIRELYGVLDARYPVTYRADWDRDGVMCSADLDAEVQRVLCTLDVTEAAVEKAIDCGANVIVSHHPLIFHPLGEITPEDPVAKRVIRLLAAGISVLSFHTRADAAPGGVNDLLASAIGLLDAVPFAEGIGRVGYLPAAIRPAELAHQVKGILGAPAVLLGDSGRLALRVAVMGGSGKGEVTAALAAGADTFLSGRLSYETVNEAKELGINLLEAGHFYTEALFPRYLAEEFSRMGLAAEYFDSCSVCVF